MVFDRTRWIINQAGNLTPRGDRAVSIDSLENAGTFFTATGDSELDDVLSASDRRSTIYIADEDLTDDRTVPDGRKFIFSGSRFRDVNIRGQWEVSQRTHIEGAGIRDDMTVIGDEVTLEHCSIDVPVTVQGDLFVGLVIEGGSITFESGTSDGIVDVSLNVSVTDNGDNTVGTIT